MRLTPRPARNFGAARLAARSAAASSHIPSAARKKSRSRPASQTSFGQRMSRPGRSSCWASDRSLKRRYHSIENEELAKETRLGGLLAWEMKSRQYKITLEDELLRL